MGRAAGSLVDPLRIGSAVAVVFWILAVLIVLGRAGFEVVPIPDVVERWGTWSWSACSRSAR